MSINSAERRVSLSNGRSADARSPFARLAELIGDIKPGKPPIDLGVGEPKHGVPEFVGPVMAAHIADFGRYPRNEGLPQFRRAAAEWAARRYKLSRVPDPDREVLVLNGSREGLFLGTFAAKRHVGPRAGRPAVLIPNPFYAAYWAGAVLGDCEFGLYAGDPRDRISTRSRCARSCAPRAHRRDVPRHAFEPAGRGRGYRYLRRAVAMARRYGFMLFCDECYSEIYTRTPPTGILEVSGDGFENVVLFQSLSKRSNLPGLRVGFVMGDRKFMANFLELRSVAAPQVPIPAQQVAIAAYQDEAHVERNRELYRQKFDLADQIIGDRYGYSRPPGGFFLWLDVGAFGGSEAVAARLWREAGVRVLPGRYAAREQDDGSNPGADYIRVAMVHDKETTADALHRIVAVLG